MGTQHVDSSLRMDLLAETSTNENQVPDAASDSSRHTEDSTVDCFNYHPVFQIMMDRRNQRRYKGVYRQYSTQQKWITWILVIYVVLVFTGDILTSWALDHEITIERLLLTVGCVIIAFIAARLALVIRWMLYWVIVAEMLTLVITNDIKALFWLADDIPESQRIARNTVWVSLIVLECLTVIFHFVTHYLYPWVGRQHWIDPTVWWRITPHRSEMHTLEYSANLSPLVFCTSNQRAVVQYCGGLDDENRPHGFGIWRDSSFHGEHLHGQWEHGRPIGPFQSREHGSGYCFASLRIAYAHNRAESKPDEVLMFPKHAKELGWGVTSVECSISGGFFSFLPQVKHLTPWNGTVKTSVSSINLLDTPTKAEDCVPVLKSPMDQLREEEARVITRPLSSANVRVNTNEALVFIHGYNCPLDYGISRLGQLLALGDFPPTLHPFVFSWPTAATLTYFPAKSIGCESEQTAKDFATFLRSIVDAGYGRIHVLTHSIGARVYFASLMRDYLDPVFKDLDAGEMDEKKAELATLTLVNADYPQVDFVKRGGAFDKSHRFCHHITVYGDRRDGALVYSEWLSRAHLLDIPIYTIGKHVGKLRRPATARSDSTESSPDEGRVTQWRKRHRTAGPFDNSRLDTDAAFMNQRGVFSGVAKYAYNAPRNGEEASNEDEILDMDVVDTTWMDNNVHNLRHNYFNLNPTMVEDLRHVIVNRRRAKERSGLLAVEGNIHIFLVAPAHVKNA